MDRQGAAADRLAAQTPSGLFEAARRKQRAFDTGTGDLEETLLAWQHCQACIERAALISRNELLDDIATSILKYLLVPYYLGKLLTERPGLAERPQNLRDAHASFTSFLTKLEQLGGIREEDLNVWHRDTALPPSTRRGEKIERARRERQLEEAITQLQKNRLDDDDSTESSGYEESERDLWINMLQLFVMKAIGEIEAIEQEMPLAERMAASETARELDLKRERQNWSTEPTTEEQRFSALPYNLPYVDGRAQKQKEVFRPYWNQPTMSVEGAAALEMRFAAKSASTSATVVGEDDASSDDEEQTLHRQRQFDDYKDQHPTGWGNRLGQG